MAGPMRARWIMVRQFRFPQPVTKALASISTLPR